MNYNLYVAGRRCGKVWFALVELYLLELREILVTFWAIKNGYSIHPSCHFWVDSEYYIGLPKGKVIIPKQYNYIFNYDAITKGLKDESTKLI